MIKKILLISISPFLVLWALYLTIEEIILKRIKKEKMKNIIVDIDRRRISVYYSVLKKESVIVSSLYDKNNYFSYNTYYKWFDINDKKDCYFSFLKSLEYVNNIDYVHRDWKKFFLKMAKEKGFKNITDFCTGLKSISLHIEDDKVEILPSDNLGPRRGFLTEKKHGIIEINKKIEDIKSEELQKMFKEGFSRSKAYYPKTKKTNKF